MLPRIHIRRMTVRNRRRLVWWMERVSGRWVRRGVESGSALSHVRREASF